MKNLIYFIPAVGCFIEGNPFQSNNKPYKVTFKELAYDTYQIVSSLILLYIMCLLIA